MKIGFLVAGIVALVVLPIVIYFYVRKIKKDKETELKTKDKNYIHQLSYFWSHIVYLFIIFTLIVMSLVLIPIGI